MPGELVPHKKPKIPSAIRDRKGGLAKPALFLNRDDENSTPESATGL